MEIFISLVEWYFIGYFISVFMLYLANKYELDGEERVSINEAVQLSLISWVMVCLIIYFYLEIDVKLNKFFDILNKKFEGEK